LTTRLRTYFGCSTLEGAFLENQGSSGSALSHWERKTFFNEVIFKRKKQFITKNFSL